MHTKTFKLHRGYRDDEGHLHRTVILRAPTVDDEIKADRVCVLRRTSTLPEIRAESSSDTLWTVALLAQCCLSIGDIEDVTPLILRRLSRADGKLLQQKLDEIEEELESTEECKASDPNPESSESTSSDSLEPPPGQSASS